MDNYYLLSFLLIPNNSLIVLKGFIKKVYTATVINKEQKKIVKNLLQLVHCHCTTIKPMMSITVWCRI